MVTVPFISPSSEVFEPLLLRRPDAIVAMVDAGVTSTLVQTGPSGRLVLAPLASRDARTLALLRLRQLISLVTFRRTEGVGDPAGQAFRLPLSHIHEEMPDDIVELPLPTVAFVAGTGLHQSLGTGIAIYEDTLGNYGEGTALASYGELVEDFIIEVVADKKALRRGIVAGLQQLLRYSLETNMLYLSLPELFGATAVFELTSTNYIDDPYVVQNRRRAQLHVTLTVPELFVAHGLARLKPSIFLEAGSVIDVVLEPSKTSLAVDAHTGELLFGSSL